MFWQASRRAVVITRFSGRKILGAHFLLSWTLNLRVFLFVSAPQARQQIRSDSPSRLLDRNTQERKPQNKSLIQRLTHSVF